MASLAPNSELFPSADKSNGHCDLEPRIAHDRLCLIYSNQEEQLATIAPFLRSGLERGEKCLYVVDESDPETISAALQRSGVDVAVAIDSGALMIVKWSAELRSGNSYPDWMVRFLEETIVAAEADGYTAFRVSGETTWALGRGQDTLNRLLDYECRVDKLFRDRNVLAICQYHRDRFRPEILLDIIHTHPLLVCGELICENPHYIPPEVFESGKHDPASEVQRLLDSIVQGAHLKQSLTAEAAARDRMAQALRESQKQLQSALADTQQLQGISAEINCDENAEGLYEKILDAAVAVMRSDFGSMQMLHPERGSGGELRLLANRGFSPDAVKFWEWVRADSESTCGVALRGSERVIVSDVEQCEWMAGSEDLATYRQTGIRAVQSTPLISRGGKLLGMISTHWLEPHQPGERDLSMLDIVARQAADLIERKLAGDRQKLAETALRKSEKFAAAGRMAATISHEINNPLEGMVNLWYLLNQEDLSPEGQAQLKMLGEELGRVSHIAKQTLEFYREGKSAGPVDLAAPIDAAVKLFSHKAEGKGATIEAHFRTSATLFGFSGELRQVFANLIGNSLEAGASNVKIRVSPTRGWAQHSRCGVRVTFSDNGSGIPADMVRRLFEPFFTTKEEKGTGLGLWVSKGIVQKHEGSIRVRSSTKPGRNGTTFSLFLPTLQDSADAPRNLRQGATASA